MNRASSLLYRVSVLSGFRASGPTASRVAPVSGCLWGGLSRTGRNRFTAAATSGLHRPPSAVNSEARCLDSATCGVEAFDFGAVMGGAGCRAARSRAFGPSEVRCSSCSLTHFGLASGAWWWQGHVRSSTILTVVSGPCTRLQKCNPKP